MKSFSVSISVTGNGGDANLKFDTNALIDSGADGKFLNKKFALENKMALTKLKRPIIPYNVDGTKNKARAIEYSTWLKIQMEDKVMNIQLLITDLGKETIILGLPWLQQYNPMIDWAKGMIDLTTVKSQSTFQEVLHQKIDLKRAVIPTEILQSTIEEIFEDLELLSNKTTSI